MMGRGFLTDDFLHLTSAAHGTIQHGILKVNAGPFYTPIAWLSYALDWTLWGWNPFAFAAGNLLLHNANILLLYLFTRRLWRSQIAGWWAALGYALLFPANVSAIMYIATRAHLLAVCFCLASLLSVLWFTRKEDRKFLAAMSAVAFATLAIFSKESGVIVPAAIALVLLHERRSGNWLKVSLAAVAGLFLALSSVLAFYFSLRSRSGAFNVSFGCNMYQYCLAPGMVLEHLFRYGWRTFGLLSLIALAIAWRQYLRGLRPSFNRFTKDDLLLPVLFFGFTIAPVILIYSRSGIYSYFSGIPAALLLGAVTRSLYETTFASPPRYPRLAAAPIIFIVVLYAGMIPGHGLRWMRMGNVSAMVLNQITTQLVKPEPNTFFVMTYTERDKKLILSDALGWGFGFALRVLYDDQSLDGEIRKQGGPCLHCDRSPLIHFIYTLDNNGLPQVTIGSKDVHLVGWASP
jgi:4-amino-4-deoxy-L-arabinose transferase-like glycosyltransferase